MTRPSGRVIRRAHLLSRLDVPERRMLQLVYLDGLPVAQAGARLGLSYRESAQLARTARQNLRAVARPVKGEAR